MKPEATESVLRRDAHYAQTALMTLNGAGRETDDAAGGYRASPEVLPARDYPGSSRTPAFQPIDPLSRGAPENAPISSLEQRLAVIWRDVLGDAPIGSNSNFFELGGHSLLAARLLFGVHKMFGKRVRMADFLRAPTLGELAALLDNAVLSVRDPQIIPIQPKGSRTPVFAIDNTGLFFPLAARLGVDRPFITIQRYDPETPQRLEPRAFEAIASDYADIVRKARPKGPYILLGLCARGVLAYEIARQLRDQGEEVPLVVILDAWAPGYTRTLSPVVAACADVSYRWQVFRSQFSAVEGGPVGKVAYLGRRAGEKLGWTTRAVEQDDWHHPHLMRACDAYRPKPYDGGVLLLRRQNQPTGRFLTPDLGWSALLTGPHRIETLPEPPAAHAGAMSHLSMFQEPCVSYMAEHIASELRRH